MSESLDFLRQGNAAAEALIPTCGFQLHQAREEVWEVWAGIGTSWEWSISEGNIVLPWKEALSSPEGTVGPAS